MFQYKPYIRSLAKYMLKKGYTEKPFPKIVLNNDYQKGVFIKTGTYIPEETTVVLYINGRHPKDVLRSLSHELIHHKQFMNNLIDVEQCSESAIIKNDYIIPFEEEAYLKGNIAFREWTETINKN